MKKILIVLLSLTNQSYGADLKPPFIFNNAKVLPQGVRNLSYKGALIDGNQKYSDTGSIVSLAEPLQKNISFQELMDGKTDPTEKGAILQAMNSIGANPSDTFGQTQGQVNVEAMAHLTVFAWGITPKLTLGTAITVLQSSVNVSVGMNQQNTALYQKMISALEDKGASKKAAEFDTKMTNPINAKAVEYNYKPIEDENKTELGDVRFVLKYLTLEKNEHRLTLQGETTLPTGTENDPDKLVTVASGDGQADVGASILYDYLITDYITSSTSLGHTVQLKDQRKMRIPEREASKVTPDTDGNTSRNLGDVSYIQTSVNYQKNYTFGLGYSFQQKGKDEYSGTLYDAERYSWLSKETEQKMHSMLVSLGYETLTAFRNKKFPVPISVSLTHSRILNGKNVVKDPITALDFSLFF
jgi:hypothetical protein